MEYEHKLLPLDESSLDNARILWDFCCIQNTPNNQSQAGFMVVFCCHDVDVAKHAGLLMRSKKASIAVASGKEGHLTKGNTGSRTEAEIFKRIMTRIPYKVSEKDIILEPKATHTLENIRLSRLALSDQSIRQINFSTGVAVTKPYSTRRVLATIQKQWESVEWRTECMTTTFHDYCAKFDDRYKELTIHFLVGEIDRLSNYGRTSCMQQAIPDTVWKAYYELREANFNIDDDSLKVTDSRNVSKKKWLSLAALENLIDAAQY